MRFTKLAVLAALVGCKVENAPIPAPPKCDVLAPVFQDGNDLLPDPAPTVPIGVDELRIGIHLGAADQELIGEYFFLDAGAGFVALDGDTESTLPDGYDLGVTVPIDSPLAGQAEAYHFKAELEDSLNQHSMCEAVFVVEQDLRPTVQIVAPGDGAQIERGQSIDVVATLADGDQPDGPFDSIWTFTPQNAPSVTIVHLDLPGTEVRDQFPAELPVGNTAIVIEVRDPWMDDYVRSEIVHVEVIASDVDKDGFLDSADFPEGKAPVDADCDDANPDVNTAATEVCNGVDDDCDGEVDEDASDAPSWFGDADGDKFGVDDRVVFSCVEPAGFAATPDDCDDTKFAIRPDAAERCNGVDDDCDALVDEPSAIDAKTFFEDLDGDTYGDPSLPIPSCAIGAGLADDDDDCDDRVVEVNPGADELCNDRDDDCDGVIDEDAAVDAPIWYVDADLDGYGTPTDGEPSCDPLSGRVEEGTDCDDADKARSPAADEVCNNVDDDCDGVLDDSPVDTPTWYTDADGDTFGDTATQEVSCDPDAKAVFRGGDCNDNVATINPDALEVCDPLDVDENCNGKYEENTAANATKWYIDADADTYGLFKTSQLACDRPSGWVANYEDCNDGNATINTKAPEVCANNIDDNCNGFVDDACDINHCGKISVDETWVGGRTHVLTCDVTVEGFLHPTLTIEGGADVRLNGGRDLSVGLTSPGRILVNGGTNPVTFRRNQTTAWGRLNFGPFDEGSVVDGATISGGVQVLVTGSRPSFLASTITSMTPSNAAVYVSASGSPIFRDNDIVGNAGSGLQLAVPSTFGDGTGADFSGNLVSKNVGVPIAIDGQQAGSIGDDNDLTGNFRDVVDLLAGGITTDATWRDVGIPFEATTVTVGGVADPTLTIEDGVVVRMRPAGSFVIGNGAFGTLDVQGTGAGVTFTSAVIPPSPGDWSYVFLYPADRGSDLTGLTVEYAGRSGQGSIYSAAMAPVLDDVTVRDGAGDGLIVASGGYAAVTDSTFVDNGGSGVTVNVGGFLDGFTENVMQGNGAFPIRLPASEVDKLDTLSTYTGNTTDTVQILTSTLARNATWIDLGVPYDLQVAVTIEGSSAPLLTVGSGVEFRMPTSGYLNVGSTLPGALAVNGTATAPVLFTSRRPVPAVSDWNAVLINDNSVDAKTIVKHAIFEYGGANGSGASVVIERASPTLQDVTVRRSGGDGVAVTGTTPAPTFDRCTFESNGRDGLHVDQVVATAFLSDPTFRNNGGYGAYLPSSAVGSITGTLVLSGNGNGNRIATGGVVSESATWPAVGYTIALGNVSVYGVAAPTLTLQPGTEFWFNRTTGLLVGGGGAGTSGSLSAVGTPTAPILFTANQVSPVRGDWYGLRFDSNCGVINVQHAIVEWAGPGTYGSVFDNGCPNNPSIRDSLVQHSSAYGIWRNTPMTITNVTYADNALGNTFP